MPEGKDTPALKLKDLEIDGEVKIKLDCAEAVKTGDNKYGAWYLWFGKVENTPKVWEGRGYDAKEINGYTGSVLFFPTPTLNKQLVEITNGNLEVDVSIKKVVEEGPKGLIRKYVATKLSEGRPPQPSNSDLTPGESKLIHDIENMIGTGYKERITEDVFVQASKEPKYGGQITEERARKLYTIFN